MHALLNFLEAKRTSEEGKKYGIDLPVDFTYREIMKEQQYKEDVECKPYLNEAINILTRTRMGNKKVCGHGEGHKIDEKAGKYLLDITTNEIQDYREYLKQPNFFTPTGFTMRSGFILYKDNKTPRQLNRKTPGFYVMTQIIKHKIGEEIDLLPILALIVNKFPSIKNKKIGKERWDKMYAILRTLKDRINKNFDVEPWDRVKSKTITLNY